MRGLIAILTATTCLVSATIASAATVYPLDRATILSQSPFDVKVEFDGVVAQGDVSVTINGKPANEILGKEVQFIEREDGVDASAIRINDVTIMEPGNYTVVAKAGDQEKTVTWEVYGTADTAKAKNVIFLIADGMSVAHRSPHHVQGHDRGQGQWPPEHG